MARTNITSSTAITVCSWSLTQAFLLPQLDGTEASSAVADPDDEPDFFEETHGLPTHVDHHHQS